MDAQRLERATQSVHGMVMALGSVVMGALGTDKVLKSVDIGDSARVLLMISLGCFAVTALVGAQLVAKLPLIEGEADEVLAHRAPLIGVGKTGFLHLTIGVWRSIQHWGMLAALMCGLLGVVTMTTAEQIEAANAASVPASSAKAN